KTRLYFLIVLVSVLNIRCTSYKVASNGYIVQNDDNFVSIDEGITISIGSNLLNDTVWKYSFPPLLAAPLNRSQVKVLKKLGYKTSSYKVIFRNSSNTPFQLIAVVNKFPISTNSGGTFIEIGKLSREESNGVKWYQETTSIGGMDVYHAVIPVEEKLFNEKYLSVIYIGELQTDKVQVIEDIVKRNSEKYRTAGQTYFPMKTMEGCPDEEAQYYDYTVPENIKGLNNYTLIKAFPEKDMAVLAYYSLLNPGQSLGAFKLCKGSYTIEYTTLDGKVLWREGIEI